MKRKRSSYGMLGKKHSPEAKRKISLNAVGNRGRKFSVAHKQKLSEANKGEKNPNFGKERSEEMNKKTSLSNLGKHEGNKTPEERKRRSLMNRGPNNPCWKGGRVIQDGYVYIWNPDHPRSDKSDYIGEHVLVMESFLGRWLILALLFKRS
jgi:NUMOD3 motif